MIDREKEQESKNIITTIKQIQGEIQLTGLEIWKNMQKILKKYQS